MRMMRRIFVLVGLTLAVPSFGVADDAASQAVVEKGIQAQGGEKQLAKFKASTSKIKGTIYLAGAPAPFTGEVAGQGADQQRVVISFAVDGQTVSLISVLNRDKGWIKINNDTIDMPAEQLADVKESAYSGWVATLLPLRDKAFTLMPFGEIEVAGRKAVGVNVTHEGHRPINLFFDNETHRLVKSETRVRDETTGQEVTEESLFSEYKPVEGAQQPIKITVKRNGKPHADVEVEEFKPAEKLDDSVFAKP